jgi:hypothetical protein
VDRASVLEPVGEDSHFLGILGYTWLIKGLVTREEWELFYWKLEERIVIQVYIRLLELICSMLMVDLKDNLPRILDNLTTIFQAY